MIIKCNKRGGQTMTKTKEPEMITRYEKIHLKKLKMWELHDRLNNEIPILRLYNVPDDLAEEIIDYTLELIQII